MRSSSADELRMLVAVRDAGSLSGAAEALGVSQQAVSQRMRAVEHRWGLALCERSSRGTVLTEHGRLVAEWAGSALAQLEGFDLAIAALRTGQRGHLRVAASLTIAEHLLPGWLVAQAATQATGQRAIAASGQRAQDGPGVHVELTAVNSETVIERVRAGKDELGFIETPDLPDGLRVQMLGHDEVVVVVAPSHPWADGRELAAAELAATAIVGRERGSGTRLALERAVVEHLPGTELVRPAAELATTAGIRATVMAGGGVGALSLRAVADDLALGRLVRVPMRMPPITRPLAAIWRQDRRLGAAAAALLAVASASLAEGRATAPGGQAREV